MTCAFIWGDIRAVTDPNEHEIAAMATASDRGGEYIDALRKTDMAQWTAEEWHGFVEAVCGGYVDALVQRQASAMEALSRVQTMP
jgi:hypothetical protein